MSGTNIPRFLCLQDFITRRRRWRKRRKKRRKKKMRRRRRKRRKRERGRRGERWGERDGEGEEEDNKTKPRHDEGFRLSMSHKLGEQGCPCDSSEIIFAFLATLPWPWRLGQMKVVCREQIPYRPEEYAGGQIQLILAYLLGGSEAAEWPPPSRLGGSQRRYPINWQRYSGSTGCTAECLVLRSPYEGMGQTLSHYQLDTFFI